MSNAQVSPTLLIEHISKDPVLRRSLTTQSHYYFCSIYLSHYLSLELAPFQHQIFKASEKNTIQEIFILAFRGSGKSTIMTFSYPLWSMLGRRQKKFILIISQTQEQARLHLTNLKKELESNELLIQDYGPFTEDATEWRNNSLVIQQTGTRIVALSTGESIRGLRHGEFRPDLIICDDIEDLQSAKTKEGRDKIFNWLTGDVIPAGDITTQLVVVGNMVHSDCLMMKLKKYDDEVGQQSVFLSYPFFDRQGKPLWPAKFNTQEKIDRIRNRTMSPLSWKREYLLEDVREEERVVPIECIQYYHELPDGGKRRPHKIVIGVDLAISQQSSADFTAMVIAFVYDFGDDLKVYISPQIVNRRLTFDETVKTLEQLVASLTQQYYVPTLCIESVAYQAALVQFLTNRRHKVIPVLPKNGMSKYDRLVQVSPTLVNKHVYFPSGKSQELINQLTDFDTVRHDDLADALTMALQYILETDRPSYISLPISRKHKPVWVEYIPGEVIDVSRGITAGLKDMQF